MNQLKLAVSGAQILFVAFCAMVLVPLLTGLNPALALLGAGLGTLLFQIRTKRKCRFFLLLRLPYRTDYLLRRRMGGFLHHVRPFTFTLCICVCRADPLARTGKAVHKPPPVVISPVNMVSNT